MLLLILHGHYTHLPIPASPRCALQRTANRRAAGGAWANPAGRGTLLSGAGRLAPDVQTMPSQPAAEWEAWTPAKETGPHKQYHKPAGAPATSAGATPGRTRGLSEPAGPGRGWGPKEGSVHSSISLLDLLSPSRSQPNPLETSCGLMFQWPLWWFHPSCHPVKRWEGISDISCT